MAQIHSKLHRIIELLIDDEVYMVATRKVVIGPAGIDDGRARHWSEYGPDAVRLMGQLVKNSTEPTFVIGESLQNIMKGRTEDFQMSMLDLKDSDLLRLPYPFLNIEFAYKTDQGNNAHAIVNLTDLREDVVKRDFADAVKQWQREKIDHVDIEMFKSLLDDKDFDVLCEVYRIEKDKDGEYLIISPSYTFLGIQRGADGKAWVKSSSRAYSYFEPSEKLDAVADAACRKDTHVAMYAFVCATLIYNTQGIAREEIECGKLNKKRIASGKPAIAKHHYLYIDRVYRSAKGEESQKYDERRHPIPHWRRAHVKGVRYGKGRMYVRQMSLPMRLVAWRGEGEEPPKPSGTTIVKTRGPTK